MLNGFIGRMNDILDHRDEVVPTWNSDETISTIVLMVVVDAEVQPIYEKYKDSENPFKDNSEMTKQFHNLCNVKSGNLGNTTVHVLKTANSSIFNRHYSGHTQAAAIAALIPTVIPAKGKIVISIGTSGSPQLLWNKNYKIEQNIGSVVMASSILFLDRMRTSNALCFDWGIWGGLTVKSENLRNHLQEKKFTVPYGIVASQLGYAVPKTQQTVIEKAQVMAMDMECAPIAQILNQTKVNFMALKVISNGVYIGEPGKMEKEYNKYKKSASEKSTEVLEEVLTFLAGKKLGEI